MFSGYFNTVLYLNMNVKKESLRIKILDYLSSHPRSEVKDIASYVQITKQALYYHIKLLSREEKIKIVDTQIINGIEKKFYSVFDDNTESISDSEVTNDSHQNLTSNINTVNNKIDLSDSEGDEQLDHSAIQTKNHNVKTDIPIDVEPTVNDKSSESNQSLTSNSAYEKNKFIANISGANNKKHSSESVSQSDSFKKNKDEDDSNQAHNDSRSITEVNALNDLEHEKTQNIAKSNPGAAKSEKRGFWSILFEKMNQPIGKKKPSSVKDQKEINQISSNQTEKSLSENLKTIYNNIKNLGLFNLDTYDTTNSATLFITSSNKTISFNNRQKSNFNVYISKENESIPKEIKRNGRLIVVEENFVDNHERVVVPIKNKNDQETFLKRYITKKYNINEDELIYTYERYDTKEKDQFELNTLFTRKKYLNSSEKVSDEFHPKNKMFISLAGLFSYFNVQLGKESKKDINLYLYMGEKGCELTYIIGSRILYNRTILISNHTMSDSSYLSESIPRIIRTIKISLDSLKKDELIENSPNNIYVMGPKSSQAIENYFKENYNVIVQNINVKTNFKNDQSQLKEMSDYFNTTMILERSFNRWGKFRYVYDQKNKTDLRKTGFFNVISLSLAIFAAVLIIFNIKLYEGRIIEGHNESNSKSTAEMTIKLINNTESAVVKNHRLGKINNSLENIKVSKHNTLELIKLLNTQIFKSMDIASIQLEVTDPNNFDQKLISVNINGGIQDRRPEAILEASNIESSLKSMDYLKNVKVDYDNYQNKTLPLTVRFTI